MGKQSGRVDGHPMTTEADADVERRWRRGRLRSGT
jgi:hypothetical protein